MNNDPMKLDNEEPKSWSLDRPNDRTMEMLGCLIVFWLLVIGILIGYFIFA